MKSYVYFIKAGDHKNAPIKIGKSNNPDKRIEVLQTGNPNKLKVVVLLECETIKRAYKLENYLHWKLRKYKLHGEWFKPHGWNLKPLLEKYEERIDKNIGSFFKVDTEIQSLKKQNKKLKAKIKELEEQIESSLDSELITYMV